MVVLSALPMASHNGGTAAECTGVVQLAWPALQCCGWYNRVITLGLQVSAWPLCVLCVIPAVHSLHRSWQHLLTTVLRASSRMATERIQQASKLLWQYSASGDCICLLRRPCCASGTGWSVQPDWHVHNPVVWECQNRVDLRCKKDGHGRGGACELLCTSLGRQTV
jgi:hypothetical protein